MPSGDQLLDINTGYGSGANPGFKIQNNILYHWSTTKHTYLPFTGDVSEFVAAANWGSTDNAGHYKDGKWVSGPGSTTNPTQPPGNPPGNPPGGAKPPPTFVTTIAGQKLTKAEYDQLAVSYRQSAAPFNRTLDDSQVHALVMNGVGGDEYRQRLLTIDMVSRNASLFDEFSKAAMAEGLISKPLSFSERANFVLKKSSGQFYDAYRRFTLAAAANWAGVSIAGPGAVPGNQTEAPK